jgi:tetratricopeptide (TPR) repeat protein
LGVLEFISHTRNTWLSKRQRRFHEIAVAMAWDAEYKERVRPGFLSVTAPPLLLGALVASLLAGCAAFEGARLYERGTQALDRGDPAAAIADLEHAAELVPQSSEIQNHLGLAHEAAGQDEAALQAFQRAVALDCSNEAAQQNLAAAEARRARLAARPAGAAREEPGPEAP